MPRALRILEQLSMEELAFQRSQVKLSFHFLQVYPPVLVRIVSPQFTEGLNCFFNSITWELGWMGRHAY